VSVNDSPLLTERGTTSRHDGDEGLFFNPQGRLERNVRGDRFFPGHDAEAMAAAGDAIGKI
jgi:hypothetical protein